MAFQVSPGVNVSEIDLTRTITPPSSSVGAIAGRFGWGPAGEVTQITSEKQLVEVFGRPTSNTANAAETAFFTAASFLSYAGDIRVIRAYESTDTNACSANVSQPAGVISPQLIANKTSYEQNYYGVALAGTTGLFSARYPGTLGNTLKVEMIANTASFSSWAYAGIFDRAPGTSQYLKSNFNNTVANDELHIVVIDTEGKFSGTPNTILEKFSALSKARNAKKPDGQSNWWRDVILKESKYIYVTNKPTVGSGYEWDVECANTAKIFAGGAPVSDGAFTSGPTYTLSGGTSTASNIDGAIQSAYNLLKTDDLGSDVSLIMSGGESLNTVPKHIVDNIAEVRKDVVVFISPEKDDVVGATSVTNIVGYRTSVLANLSSSYAVMDSGWKYMYDKYNEIYRWVPLNGDIAGLCARTDYERDPWFSPAGLTRGQIKNALKLAYNPNKAERDILYKNGINPVVSASGDGTLLFGDKTMLSYASAFDRINVRRLFITLEKAISRAARTSLFEFNDEFTRAQFVNLVEPFLRTVQGRRGIYDFRVVCDETNNTPDVIDRNEFVGDIYIKPARSINFIQLNFVAVATGVSFEEVVGQF